MRHCCEQTYKLDDCCTDESSQEVLQYHTDTKQHYAETLDNLARINSTVARVLTMLTQLRLSVEQRLAWLASLVGGTGGQDLCKVFFYIFVIATFLSGISF